MIKIATPGGDGQPERVYLGLSHGNLDRLREGQPIRLDIDQCAMLGLGQRELIIYSGASEIEMSQESHRPTTRRVRQKGANLMDPNGHIYMDDEGKIPAEDKARLDGYLRGRAESDAEKIAAMRERVEAMEARVRDAKA